MKRIAILALQGAFAEHAAAVSQLGAEPFEVRQLADWQQHKDALIIPGGESTVIRRLLRSTGLLSPILNDIRAGLPVLGTCAGLILLSRHVEGEPDDERLGTMDITTCRNAYGRQLGSFHTVADFKGIGEIPMTFIRAPYIKEVGKDVEVLATVDNRIVAARQGNQIVTAFHPELTSDLSIHRLLLSN